MSIENEEFPEEFEEASLEEQLAEEEEGQQKFGFIRRNAPTLMMSMALHFIVLLIVSLIPRQSFNEEEDRVIITEYIEDQKEDTTVEKIDIVTDEIKVDTEIKPEQETEEMEEEESFDETTLEDTPEAMPAEEPTEDIIEAMPSTLGLKSNMAVSKMPSGYGNRTGKGKRRAIGRYGGQGTQQAVDLALKWLYHHQEPNGEWHATKYQGKNKEHINTTALALLPFLGAGHSENVGTYKKTVRNGIRVLNKTINDKGGKPYFGRNYGSGIILMALSEASLFGSSVVTKKNADQIAQMFINDYDGMGWGYSGAGTDFSVSGWIALGLKSGKAAGLNALSTASGKQALKKYSNWVDKEMTKPNGTALYDPSKGKKGSHSQNMIWVGMFQKQFLGFPKNDPFLVAGASKSMSKIEDLFSGDSIKDSYGIYYGTLAAFQHQREFWRAWNARMKPHLLKTQRKGDPRDMGGSWDPNKGRPVGKNGGRVMTTALMALCLEVYYRYQQMN